MVQKLVLPLHPRMDDSISYNFIDTKIPDFNPEFFSLWINGVVGSHSKSLSNLSYIFCTDEYLLEMNQSYLDHDDYTDIITFNYNEGDSLSGDLFISYPRIVENASIHDQSVWDELCRVMIHGVLHLIGYNDKTAEEQQLMRKQEDKSLEMRKSFT